MFVFPLNGFATLIKKQTTDMQIYIWTLNPVPLSYMSILCQYFLGCSSFVVYFQIRKCESSNFVSLLLLLFNFLSILNALKFYMDFRISLLISIKRLGGILMGSVFHVSISLNNIVIFKILSILIYEHGIFPMIIPSLISLTIALLCW